MIAEGNVNIITNEIINVKKETIFIFLELLYLVNIENIPPKNRYKKNEMRVKRGNIRDRFKPV